MMNVLIPDTEGASTVSLLTCDLGLVLELTGGFSATCLAYIFRKLASLQTYKCRR